MNSLRLGINSLGSVTPGGALSDTVYVFGVRSDGGTSAPQIYLSTGTTTWEALVDDAVVATYETNSPNHNFTGGSTYAWRLTLPGVPGDVTRLALSSDKINALPPNMHLLMTDSVLTYETLLLAVQISSLDMSRWDASNVTNWRQIVYYSGLLHDVIMPTTLSPATNYAYAFQGCGLSEQSVTNIIKYVRDCAEYYDLTGGTLNMDKGTSSPPDAEAQGYIAELQARGYTIITN